MERPLRLITAITVSESKILIRGQLNYMAQNGFETYLLYSPEEVEKTITHHESARELHVAMEREISPLKDIFSLMAIVKLFNKIKPDIVNAGTPKAGFLCIIAAWICRVPVRIYTVRGYRHESLTGIRRSIMRACEWIIGKLATKIICISPSVKELGISEGLLPLDKSIVLAKGSSNGMDLVRFNRDLQSSAELETKRQLLNLQKEDVVLGFVGRLVPRKGVYELIESWKEIRERFTNTKLLIVGAHESDQPLDGETLKVIESDNRIITTGKVTDVPAYMALMDLFVFPAHWEGFGNVLIEAAAMGVPVVTTTGTGVRDAVNNGFNAVTIPVRNIPELTKAVANYLEDDSMRTAHGRNGIEWSRNFSNEHIWSAMRNLYYSEYEAATGKKI